MRITDAWEMADLFKRILKVDTSKRATISDIVQHPWVQVAETASPSAVSSINPYQVIPSEPTVCNVSTSLLHKLTNIYPCMMLLPISARARTHMDGDCAR